MIGQTIKGKYRVYDVVGSGGFATVYLGRNMDTNEIVAIKVLSQQFTTESRYIERFRREASLAQRLNHPNIVRVLDYGIEHDMHFLVMEFVEGLTLEQIIQRRGPLPIDELLSFAKQTCAGLQAAYRVGIVHRDIKPANLMITPDGTVKIMDFGIARMESMGGLTQTGLFLGTPRYISPEMARGSGTDTRSDLYAVGLLIYEMLAGVPPFDADNPWAVLRLQVEKDPAPIHEIRPDVPPWLEGIMLRALAKDPAQRFQTPAEMLAALDQQTVAPAQMPKVVHRTPTPTPVAAAPGREQGLPRGLILGLLAAVFVVAAGLTALVVFATRGRSTPPTPVWTAAVAQAASNTPTPVATRTPTVQVVADTPTAIPTVVEPSATETQPPPTATAPEPSDTPPAPTGTPTPEPTNTPPPTDTPTPSPTDTPEPTASPTSGPTPTPQPTETATSPPAPAVTGRLTFSTGGTLHIVDASTGQRLFSVPSVQQPDFRRDGTQIIANGRGGAAPATLVNINASNGAIMREQTAFTDDFHPFWSPDGSRFAYDSLHHGLRHGQPMLYTQGLTGGRVQPEVAVGFAGQQIRGTSPVWMEDEWLAFTGCDYWPEGTGGSQCGIYRMPSWGGEPAMLRSGGTGMRATDSHGTQLLFMSQESGDWEVYVMPNQGGAPRNLSNSPSSQDGLGTFSPDGKLVGFVSNRGGNWAVWAVGPDGSNPAKLFDLPGAPTSPWYEDSMSWGP